MELTINQRILLNTLLDKYERSKTHDGTNLVSQTFAVAPSAVWNEYNSDFADIESVKDFETEMHYLQSQGLILIREKAGAIIKLTACNEKLEEYYKLLGRIRKKEILQAQIAFYKQWCDRENAVITYYCREQLERLTTGRKAAYTLEQTEDILRIIDFLSGNREELMERELSILLFGDSKIFQSKYRNKVCKILKTYVDFSEKLDGVDDEREQEKIILEEFGIYTNPDYVYLKGNINIILENGQKYLVSSAPLALSSAMIKKMSAITVETPNIVTIENLTSFHRIHQTDCTCIYLAGYHNSEKQQLLKRIHMENPDKKWFHFGDIDPDGFYILEHLIRGTGIQFTPLFMGIKELKKYGDYCKKLTDNDCVKAGNLMLDGRYTEILQYMLKYNCKLEQEIVSLKMGKSNRLKQAAKLES